MKLFCVSDVHSHYSAMKKALAEAGFDEKNPEHYLVSLGDLFDRGPESEELLSYIMSLDRKILIRGNHDYLLEECCMREFPYSHDKSNGTLRTIQDLGRINAFDECCRNTWNRTAAYRDMLVNYLETARYIFVHSFIPLRCLDDLPKYYIKNRQFEYDPDWRNATTNAWEQATWGNPFELAEQGLNKTGKILVFGHWNASYPRAKYEGKPEFDEGADFSPYYGDNYVALDACTAYTGKVNVIIIEDSFLDDKG